MKFEWFGKVRVLELASVLAGPGVGRFFAEMGAEVIKIENPASGGDVTRSWKLPEESEEQPESAYFYAANYGKRHLFLDLSTGEGKAELQSLLKGTDILISNFRPSSARKLGLDYKSLKTQHEQLIYIELSSFELDPERPAFDIGMQAETGFLSMCGCEQGHPARLPVALIDLMAAHQAKEAALLALLRREKEGRGAHVRLSLEASALCSLANQASNWLVAGHQAGRMGCLHPNIAPYGEMVRTSDGTDIILAVGSDKQFNSLCKALDMEALGVDERFCDNRSRVVHRKKLQKRLSEGASKFTSSELTEKFERGSVPYGRVRSVGDALSGEAAKKYLVENVIGNGHSSIQTCAFNIY